MYKQERKGRVRAEEEKRYGKNASAGGERTFPEKRNGPDRGPGRKDHVKKEGFRFGSTDRRDGDGKRAEKTTYRTNRDENRATKEEEENILFGRNPVREAIKADRGIDRILVAGDPDGSIREILHLAQEKKIVIREVERKKLDEITLPFGFGGKPANHQGIVAYGSCIEYVDLEEILRRVKEKGEDPFLLILDGITDPQNLGSILRSADCAGVNGVVIGKRRCASVSAAAVKTAAGAAEHIPVSKVANITNAVRELKQKGIWIAGADMEGIPMTKANMKGPVAIVIGSEGEGISSLVKQNCDYLVSVPITGHIGSLNAAVAAAVLMYEAIRS